jgi:hypothetical protein
MRENMQERAAISFTAIEDFRGLGCIKLEPSDNFFLVDKLIYSRTFTPVLLFFLKES